MWELTKRISLRISTVLSKVEPEPGAGPLHRLQLRPKSTVSGFTTLAITAWSQNLCRLTLCGAGLSLPWNRIGTVPVLNCLKNYYCNIALFATFFVSFLKFLKAGLSKKFKYLGKNEFFKKYYFCPFIRPPDGYDSWNKNSQKILWYCHFKSHT